MPARRRLHTVGRMANDHVLTLEPAFAGAALAGIQVQLETAAFHLHQALEREARLRRRLERDGPATWSAPAWATVDAALSGAARARAALLELAR
jgi:hypothetical protein